MLKKTFLDTFLKLEEDGNKGGGGGGGDDWRASLPEDIRGHQEIVNTPDLATAAKRIIDQSTFISQSIRIPGEDASDEDRGKFYEKIMAKVPDLMRTPEAGDTAIYSRLGKPEKADGYKLPEQEGISFDNEQTKAFREYAFKNNLTQAQFEGLVKDFTETNIQRDRRTQASIDASIKKLSDEWGPAYQERVAQVRHFAEVTAAPKVLQDLIKSGKAGHETMTWLHGLVKQVSGEGGQLKILPQGGKPLMSSTEAKAKIAEIRGNKQHPYWDKTTGQAHAAAKEKMRELYKIAYPEG